MSTYVDGFVIPIPRNNVAAHKKMAKLGCKTWMKHGALSYFECLSDDTKAHRNKVNAKVHKAFSQMPGAENFSMPLDVSKMAYGGFKTLIQGKFKLGLAEIKIL